MSRDVYLEDIPLEEALDRFWSALQRVNALEPFQEGRIILDGIRVNDPKTDLPKLRARVGMVFQHFELFPHLRINENLCLAQEKVLGRSHDEALAKGKKLKVLTEEEIEQVFALREPAERSDFEADLAEAGIKVKPLDPGERYTVMRIPGEAAIDLDKVVRGPLDPARLDD